MAKKLILAGLVLFSAIFFTNLLYAGDSHNSGRASLLPVARSVSGHLDPEELSYSPDSRGRSPSFAGSERHFRATGWRSWMPSKNQFDRLLCAAALVGVGIAVGMTVSTCNDMKGACATAQGELGQCSGLLQEIKRISILVCRLDPTLCPDDSK